MWVFAKADCPLMGGWYFQDEKLVCSNNIDHKVPLEDPHTYFSISIWGKTLGNKVNYVNKYWNIVQLVRFNLPCVVESSFFCHDRTVEIQNGYCSESKKPGKSSETLPVLGLGDSGGEVDGEARLMGWETVEAGLGLKNETNVNCLPRWYCYRMITSLKVWRRT